MAADFELKQDMDNHWYWTFQNRDGTIIASSSKRYREREACIDSIRSIRELAAGVPVYDMTGESPEQITDVIDYQE